MENKILTAAMARKITDDNLNADERISDIMYDISSAAKSGFNHCVFNSDYVDVAMVDYLRQLGYIVTFDPDNTIVEW